MRSILGFTCHAENDDGAVATVLHELSHAGWTVVDLQIDSVDLATMARSIVARAVEIRSDLPSSPESHQIQGEIDRFTSGDAAGPGWSRAYGAAVRENFTPFSAERDYLEQTLLVLTQIDPSERRQALQSELAVIHSPTHRSYGILFSRREVGRASGPVALTARIRSEDLERLQTDTASFVATMRPQRTRAWAAFWSDFGRIEIRSITNERLFDGTAIPITGRFSLLRQSFRQRSARLLGGLSVVLVAVSAVLYQVFPEPGWGMWTDEMVGRLATGAFGALLVDGALDYTALRRSLSTGRGTITRGALIDWNRV